MPSVILCIKEEVGADNSDAYCHDNKNAVHQQHESVDVVELVVPERSEDEVHLNKNAAEREDSRNQDDGNGTSKPTHEGGR